MREKVEGRVWRFVYSGSVGRCWLWRRWRLKGKKWVWVVSRGGDVLVECRCLCAIGVYKPTVRDNIREEGIQIHLVPNV